MPSTPHLRTSVVLLVAALGQSALGQTSRPATPTPSPRSQPAAKATSATPTVRPVWRDTNAMLDARVAKVDFQDAPLDQVLEWVGQQTGALVYARWSTLATAGINRDQPVTARLENRPMWMVLWVILNEAAGPSGVKLAYEATTDTILISTHADLSRRMVTVTYDVSSVAIDIPDFSWNPCHPAEKISRTIVDRDNRVGGAPGSTDPGFPRIHTVSRDQITDAERMQEIAELVQMTIEPESWAVNGFGGEGTVFPYKGRLVIRNSLYVQQLIGGALRMDEVVESSQTSQPRPPAKSTHD